MFKSDIWVSYKTEEDFLSVELDLYYFNRYKRNVYNFEYEEYDFDFTVKAELPNKNLEMISKSFMAAAKAFNLIGKISSRKFENGGIVRTPKYSKHLEARGMELKISSDKGIGSTYDTVIKKEMIDNTQRLINIHKKNIIEQCIQNCRENYKPACSRDGTLLI